MRYTQALAHEVHFPEDARRDLVYGAVLRDIGMLRIDPAILRISGQLTSEQWEIVRRHTLEGAQIMRQMRIDEIAVDVVLHHHEAYNGEGYPAGLRGRAIPLGARLVAVAESYVKMTMDRSYRKAIGPVEALPRRERYTGNSPVSPTSGAAYAVRPPSRWQLAQRSAFPT